MNKQFLAKLFTEIGSQVKGGRRIQNVYGNRRYDGIGTGGMYFLGEMTKICLLIGIFQKHNKK